MRIDGRRFMLILHKFSMYWMFANTQASKAGRWPIEGAGLTCIQAGGVRERCRKGTGRMLDLTLKGEVNT